MQLKKISLVLLGFLLSLTLFTQNIKDSSIAVPLTGLHFSAQKSFGDLSNRFGNTGNIGIPIVYKMKSNWIIGIASYWVGYYRF